MGSVTGCGTDPHQGPRVLRVPEAFKTIQGAVDDAEPGDLVLIAPGRYHEAVQVRTDRLVIRGVDRNTVVLDGGNELANGFEVRADQVAIENLTVQRYSVNGVFVTGTGGPGGGSGPSRPVGWHVRYVTAANNGLYGLYAFATGPGRFDHNEASGSPDSGIYVGQCRRCGAQVLGNRMERNAIGLEVTNASGVTIAGNDISRNRVGAVLASGDTERLAPQVGALMAANRVADNANPGAPATRGAFGDGIVIAGGRHDRVERNLVVGHPGAGIVVTDQAGYRPIDNTIVDNMLRRNVVDLAFTTESGDPPLALGNCFGPHQGTSSNAPPRLTELLPCPSGADVSLPRPTVALPSQPVPVDYRRIPLPRRQRALPRALILRWQAPGRTPPRFKVSMWRVPAS